MTGVAKNTIVKLLADLGRACEAYQIEKLVNLPCKRLQCDEIWSFVGAKQKNAPADKQGQWGIGDVWTWTAICADTKLVPSWLVADRSAEAARDLLTDLSGRLANRVQVTSDGLKLYVDAVEQAFGTDRSPRLTASSLPAYAQSDGAESPSRRFIPVSLGQPQGYLRS
ncbi:MAG TPA: hypothetical protein VHO06_18560 [Polyangia bacterium]|nr:hypothetical protein [Polyangia bacterium]